MVATDTPPREIYPNAPLKLVAVELRHPLSGAFTKSSLLADLAELLGPDLPIIDPLEPAFQIAVGPGLHQSGPAGGPGSGFRFSSRDRTLAVTVASNRLLIETTAYRCWEVLREVVAKALDAVGNRLGAISGFERLGMRYINEIRTGPDADVARWARYIQPDFLPFPPLAAPYRPIQGQVLLQIVTGELQQAVVRYGTAEGNIVGSGLLRLPSGPGEGPFFFIDIDSYSERGEMLQPFDQQDALETLNGLHAPVREIFERAITDDLRNEFLRRAGS